MIASFRNKGTEDIFDGEDTKVARKILPSALNERAGGTLDRLNAAVSLRSLGDRAGQHSIRINDKYRICFRWTDAGAEDVEVVDYH